MGGNHGRDGEMTEKEKEGGEGEIFWALTGQHTCRSGPQISACAHLHHLDGSDLHRTTRKVENVVSSPKICDSFPRDVRSLITAWLDLIQRADVSHSEVWSWKMNSFSLKQQNHFLLLPSFLFFVAGAVCFFLVLCCGQALTVALSLALSPLSHSVFNICPVGLYLSKPFSTQCCLLDVAQLWCSTVAPKTTLISCNPSAIVIQHITIKRRLVLAYYNLSAIIEKAADWVNVKLWLQDKSGKDMKHLHEKRLNGAGIKRRKSLCWK